MKPRQAAFPHQIIFLVAHFRGVSSHAVDREQQVEEGEGGMQPEEVIPVGSIGHMGHCISRVYLRCVHLPLQPLVSRIYLRSHPTAELPRLTLISSWQWWFSRSCRHCSLEGGKKGMVVGSERMPSAPLYSSHLALTDLAGPLRS